MGGGDQSMSTGVVYNSNPVQVQNAQIGGSSSPVPAGQWTSGLFECCHPGCGTCCFACCCTSCLLGQVSDLMHSDDYCCAGGYFGACCCHFMLGGGFTLATMLMTGVYVPAFGVCVSCPVRAGVRKKYNIDGNAFLDCCVACWCEPCSAEQASKELKTATDHATRAADDATRAADDAARVPTITTVSTRAADNAAWVSTSTAVSTRTTGYAA